MNTSAILTQSFSTMNTRLIKLKNRFLNSGDLVSTFLRSTVASQLASWIDMGMGFVFFAWVHLAPWLSTAIGNVFGGVVNCCINYRFTFHASSVPVKAVAVKYAMIWTGSLLLNVFGTQLLYILFNHFPFLEDIGFKPNGYYAAARGLTSLLVSLFWNFTFQKNFVYKNTRFDPYAIRFVNLLIHRKSSPNTKQTDSK